MRHHPRTVRSLSLAALALIALSFSPARATPVPLKAQAAASTGAWTMYHRDDAHTGFDSTLPNAMGATTGWVSSVLDEEVFASPLVFNGVVYAATLNNTVYALDQATGAVIWSKNVGAPQTSGWTCGNISQTGILGTPVIDTAANRIYAVAELAGTTPTYHLFGLDLANLGNIVLDTTLAPTGFNWAIQQERGALAIHNGTVYVPFGGRWGDCGSYHGYVFAVSTSTGTITGQYTTSGTGAGFWAAGGVVVDDATNKVFVTSGNGTSGCAANPDGSPVNEENAVVRLSATTLAHEDAFVPQDWASPYCAFDEDLGGAGPMLISSSLLFQAGKAGGGFLLNPNALGGLDGQLFPTPKPQTYAQADVCYGNHSDATFGSFAYAAPFVYLQCNGGRGLVGLNVSAGAPSFSVCDATCAPPTWKADYGVNFGPPIVAGGAVWAASNSGLYAFNASSGTQLFHSASFGINNFVTPAEAGGQVFVPSHFVIRSFNMTFGPWTSLNGILISGPDASSWGASRVDVFAVGGDRGLWQNTRTSTAFGGWVPLGGIVTGDPGAASWGVGRIDVFVRGQDGAMYHRYSDGTTWFGWEGLGGGMKFGPTVASMSPQRLDIFITGLDNQLWHKYWNGGWGGWEPLGGVLTSKPAVVSWGNNRLDIFARGSDNQMWHMDWHGTGWGGWAPLGGLFSSGPDAASCTAGHLDVFAVGMDGGLWRLSLNGSAWTGWQPMGLQWTSDPSAVCEPGTTTVDLFDRGPDNAIWHTTVTGA